MEDRAEVSPTGGVDSASCRSRTVDDLQLLHPVQAVQRRHQRVVLAPLLAVLALVLVGEDRVRLIQQEGQPAGRQALLTTRTQSGDVTAATATPGSGESYLAAVTAAKFGAP